MSRWGGIVCVKVLSGWENESAAMKGENVPGRGTNFYKVSEARKCSECSRNNRGLHVSGVSTEWGIDHEVCEVEAGPLNQYEDAGFYCEWLANHYMSWEHKAQSWY